MSHSGTIRSVWDSIWVFSKYFNKMVCDKSCEILSGAVLVLLLRSSPLKTLYFWPVSAYEAGHAGQSCTDLPSGQTWSQFDSWQSWHEFKGSVSSPDVFKWTKEKSINKHTAQRTQGKRITLQTERISLQYPLNVQHQQGAVCGVVKMELDCLCNAVLSPAASQRSLSLTSGSAEDPCESYS